MFLRFISRWALVVLLFTFVGLVGWLAPEDLGIGVTLESNKAQPKPVDQVMHGVHLIETSDGRNEWELRADRAMSFKGKGSWDVEKVNVIFYGNDGVQFKTTGDRGVVTVNTKDMLIDGNVVTKSSNDYQFYTDSVIYSSSRRELNTARPVKILGPKDADNQRMILNGIGMLALMNTSEMFVHENVRGEKILDSGRVLKIKSHEAKMSGLSRQADFIGDVEMFMDTMTVTGPKAVFKYGPKQNALQSIEVVGGVRVSDENKWATSKTLDIAVPENRYVLNGSPRVVQNTDEIEGEQIVLLNGGKQVQVISGRASLSEKKSEKNL